MEALQPEDGLSVVLFLVQDVRHLQKSEAEAPFNAEREREREREREVVKWKDGHYVVRNGCVSNSEDGEGAHVAGLRLHLSESALYTRKQAWIL